MKSFELKRFNLKQKNSFTLRSPATLSEALVATAMARESIAMAQKKAQQAYRFQTPASISPSLFERVGQLVTQTILVSLMIMTPIAEAHATAAKAKKKRKVVEYVFESKPASDSNVQKTRSESAETKIVRTLKPVNGYESSADEKALEDDLENVPMRTIASVTPRIKRPIRADAGITADVLNEESAPTAPAFPMSQPTKKIDSKSNLEETDINLVEEYY